MIKKLEPRHFGPDSGFGGATFSDVIDKVNEIIDAMNGEHDPADIYSEDGRLIAKKDESEDERMIRKIEMFLSAYGADYFSNDEWRKIEDWLEKQKGHQNNSGAPNESSEDGLISSSRKDKNLDEIAQDYVDNVKEYNPEPTWDLMQTAVCYGYHYREQQEQKPISSCDIVPYIDDKIAALQDMWRKEKVSFDWDDMKDMIEDVARHFYHKEQKPSTGIYWHAIKRGEKIPCRAYLYKVAYETENNFGGRATIDGLLVPNIENVTCGCDTWYLPADDVKNLPREGLDELQKEQKPNSTEDMPYIADERFYEREPADSFKYKLAEYMTKCCTKKEGPYGYTYGISAESILELAKEELIKRGAVQKPAEWSKEDEKKIHFLSRLIEFQVKDDEYCFGDGSLISKQEAIEMLKSLRPPFKPSEEQMDALAYAIQILDDGLSPKAAKAGEELEGIREHFKKL